jgi:hypothetical protein
LRRKEPAHLRFRARSWDGLLPVKWRFRKTANWFTTRPFHVRTFAQERQQVRRVTPKE